MRLKRAQIQNYRSIRDTGWFDVDEAKTILVGPNEAGKTAILEALQRVNAPEGTSSRSIPCATTPASSTTSTSNSASYRQRPSRSRQSSLYWSRRI